MGVLNESPSGGASPAGDFEHIFQLSAGRDALMHQDTHWPSLRLARVWSAVPALQDSRLLNNARKAGNRLFVDGRRRLSLARLLNLRQVSTGQDGQEAGCHAPSKRTLRQ